MSIYRSIRGVIPFVIVAASLGSVGGALAQSDDGTIIGSVADQTGAVVPNAAIAVTNIQTGLKFRRPQTNPVSSTSPRCHVAITRRGSLRRDSKARR